MHSSLAEDLNFVLVWSAYFGLINSAELFMSFTYLSTGLLKDGVVFLKFED